MSERDREQETSEERRSPYKGLAPYEEADAAFFFGRERDARVIVANLYASPLTLLYGPSGVGKTSLLQAGVVGALREEGVPVAVVRDWHGEASGAVEEAIRNAMRGRVPAQSDTSLFATLDQISDRERPLVIMLDQFEEYLLYHRAGSPFDEQLANLAANVDGVSVLIAIRDDALARLDRFETSIPDLFENYLRIERLDRRAARDAIERPLEPYSQWRGERFRVEPELAEGVLNQLESEQRAAAGPFGEKLSGEQPVEGFEGPLLQVVMARVWEAETSLGSSTLSMATLKGLGGVQQILRAHVRGALSILDPDEQRDAALVFPFLVTPTGMKFAITARDLAAWSHINEGKLSIVLEKLASEQSRILRPVRRAGNLATTPYEILHDVLANAVTEWATAFRARLITPASETWDPRDATATMHGIASYLSLPNEQRRGMAFCMSGGGYRAALFHLGALRRLNELGLLSQVDTFTSVSGGSIVASQLATFLAQRGPSERGAPIRGFEQGVADPMRAFAGKDIRTRAALARLNPRNWFASDARSKTLAAEYAQGPAPGRLADLPQQPRFIFLATDMYFRDQWVFDTGLRRVGSASLGFGAVGEWTLADAVAASSSVPGAFGMIHVEQSPVTLVGGTYVDPDREELVRKGVDLADGGMFDNLGLEPIWRDHAIVLVSDAAPSFRPGSDAIGWLWGTLRHGVILLEQATEVRKRWLISSFIEGILEGTYWGIASRPMNYEHDSPPQSYSAGLIRDFIATIRIDFDVFSQGEMSVLENHGYLMAEIAMRRHGQRLVKGDWPEAQVPHPEWMDEARAAAALRDSGDTRVFFAR